MAEYKSPIDPIEALRLEVERARLALEQARYQNDMTQTFFERWRVDVQPVHEHRLMSREQSYGYAKIAIQTTFLLNGGALIAFPAFAQLIGTGFRDHVGWALTSIGGFILGLVLIAITTLLAYFSMAADLQATAQREEYVKAGLNQSQAPKADKSKYEKIREDAESARKRHYDFAIRFEVWAVYLGIASIVSFVFGALCAARVLLGVSPVV